MWDVLRNPFDTTGFVPRWTCGLWTPAHGWLHVLSDLGVWSAYFVIPLVLGGFVLRRRELPFRGVAALFVVFILSCGLTHLLEAAIFWWPAYRLAGLLKLETAVVSWVTVFALARVAPQVLAFRSPAELQREIDDRRRAEDALRASEERFRAAFDNAPIGMALVGLDGRFLQVNRALAELLGRPEADLLATDFQSVTHPDDLAGDAARVRAVLAGEQATYQLEKRYLRPDGQVVHALLAVALVRDPAGRPQYFVSQIKDISARKRAEERTAASLREKEVLLKEIHHRVKNNLQIVSALLDLQSGYTADPQALELFRESRGRVRSMALIHERLYRSHDVAGVDFGEYTRRLADDLCHTYKAAGRVRVEVAADGPPLGVDVAIPCGLLVNEAVSNCLKHAFPGDRAGAVRVAHVRDDGHHLLTVADDGVGLPLGFDPRAADSFGMQLIATLADQLGGDLAVTGGPGTRVRVRFPARG